MRISFGKPASRQTLALFPFTSQKEKASRLSTWGIDVGLSHLTCDLGQDAQNRSKPGLSLARRPPRETNQGPLPHRKPPAAAPCK